MFSVIPPSVSAFWKDMILIFSALLNFLTVLGEPSYRHCQWVENLLMSLLKLWLLRLTLLTPTTNTLRLWLRPNLLQHSGKKDQKQEKCFYCGGPLHSRNFCPTREQKCHNCKKRGRFAKVCRSESFVKPISASAYLKPSSLQPHSLVATANADITCER